jgi:hypothetical protein
MPYSSQNGKKATSRFLRHFNRAIGIKSFLDIGAGSGTYSDLYRHIYRDYFEDRYDGERKGVRWDAVEVWKPYIADFRLFEKYDNVYSADARTMFDDGGLLGSAMPCQWSVAFLGDVLEHMTKEEAVRLVWDVTGVALVTIISIPIVHYPQGEYMGNPYEEHIKDDWSHNEVLESFYGIEASYVDGDIGIYVIPNPLARFRMDYDKALNGPFVSAYGIFKDEEKFMQRFLDKAWAAGFDEIVLCDTGANAETKQIVKDWNPQPPHNTERLVVKEISVQPWRFDEARNAALAFCDPNADLCVSIDIDEYVDETFIPTLKKAWTDSGGKSTRIIHKFKTFWDPADPANYSEHFHERVHARQGYRWSLPVHEILEKYDGDESVAWATDCWMYQEPDMTKARGSYFELLKASVAERPDIWKSWSFLSSEYSYRGDAEEAKRCIKEAMKCKDADMAFLHYQLASFVPGSVTALAELQMASSLNGCREIMVYLADEYYRQGNWLMARAWIERAEKETIQTQGYMYNPSCWNEHFDMKVQQYKEMK